MVRPEVWDLLDEAKRRAQEEDEEVAFDFPITSGAFLIRPHGWRGYTFWLSAPDLELMVGRSEKFPAVLCQLHAAYLHSVGVGWALEFVELLLRHDVFASSYELLVSRLDIYADMQGWVPVLEDLHRFVGSRHAELARNCFAGGETRHFGTEAQVQITTAAAFLASGDPDASIITLNELLKIAPEQRLDTLVRRLEPISSMADERSAGRRHASDIKEMVHEFCTKTAVAPPKLKSLPPSPMLVGS